MMSIRKLKLCGESILKPLELIFRFCIESIKHLNNWKKVNVVRVHKKSHKQVLKNYRPIPLLPICGKKFERLIFNKMFKFFVDNDLTSPYQSRFKRGDSWIDQVFSVTHDIYTPFDDRLEIKGVFVDIPEDFDKGWYEESF